MPCPPSVPISIIPPVGQGVGPLVWANGSQVARLTVPLNPSWLVYDGSVTRWGDGSVTAPVLLPALQEVDGSQFSFLIGSTASGQLAKSSSAVVPTATNASNLIGGQAGYVVYQSGSNTTAFLPQGSAGQVLSCNGVDAIGWITNSSTAVSADNLNGGTGGVVPYQSGVNTTGFSAVGTNGQVLTSGGTGVPTWTTATDANTTLALVKRDGSGNFSAGTITASLSGNATSATSATSASSAATLTTARTIALSGDVTGTATSFNGSANISIPVAINTGAIVPAYLSTGGPTWDTSGNFTVQGTSAPSLLKNIGNGIAATILSVRYDNTAFGGFVSVQKNRGSLASPSAVQAGDEVGAYYFQGNAGSNVRNIANISGIVESIVSDTSISGAIAFSTNTASTSISEKMRITAVGNVGIGTSSPTANLDVVGNINASGTITGFGVTNGSNAAAGVVGQYVASQVTTGVTMTQAVATNITSITLTAGDWDVTSDVYFTYTTSVSTLYQLTSGISTTSATFGSQDTYAFLQIEAILAASRSQCFVTPTVRLSLTAASTTVYLVAQAGGGLSSITGKGTIRARRIR